MSDCGSCVNGVMKNDDIYSDCYICFINFLARTTNYIFESVQISEKQGVHGGMGETQNDSEPRGNQILENPGEVAQGDSGHYSSDTADKRGWLLSSDTMLFIMIK
jgi:hypothetical protein